MATEEQEARREVDAAYARQKVEVIARLMALTGKGEPFDYWVRAAGEVLTSLDQRTSNKRSKK